MIQRIQSLYLLIVFALTVTMLAVPFGSFIGGAEEFVVKAWGIENAAGETVVPMTEMGILLVVCCLLAFITIFFYRHRWIQMRMCVFEMIFLLGLQVFVGFYLFRSNSVISDAEIHSINFSVTDILPLVCIILIYLAFRGILKDETLVKSLNRIR